MDSGRASQRRESAASRGIDLRAVAQQRTDYVGVAIHCRSDQRGDTLAVGNICIRTVRKESIHGLRMTADCGREEGGRSGPRAIIWIRALLKQDMKHGGLSLCRCQNENRSIVLIAQFPVRPLHKKKTHNLGPPGQSRRQQRSNTIPVACVHRGAFAEQRAHTVQIAVRRSANQIKLSSMNASHQDWEACCVLGSLHFPTNPQTASTYSA